jgi:O-antigen polymerase
MTFLNKVTLYVLIPLGIFATLLSYNNSFSFLFFQDRVLVNAMMTLVVAIYFLFRIRKHIELSFSYTDLAFSIYVLYLVLNSFVLGNKSKTLDIFDSFTLLLVFYAGKTVFTQIKNTYSSLLPNFILVVTAIPILVAILELAGIIPIFGSEFIFTGGFLNQGQFANFLSIVFPVLIWVVINSQDSTPISRIIYWLFMLGTFVLLCLSMARSAWIAAFISSVFIISIRFNIHSVLSKYINTSIKRVIAIALLTVFVVSSAMVLYHVKKDSANGRILIWSNTVEMIKDKPFLGHGVHSFSKKYNQYQLNYFKENNRYDKKAQLAGDVKFAFNDYLQKTAETGLIGFLLFGILLFFTLRKKESILSSNNVTYESATKASILALLICSLFSYPLESASIRIIFVLLIAYISSFTKTKFIFGINKPFQTKIIQSTILFLIAFTLFFHTNRIILTYRWTHSFEQAQTIEVNDAIQEYEKLYPKLSYHWAFLFNYGSILDKVDEIEKGITVLNEAKQIQVTYDLCMNLGDYYYKEKQFDKAIQNYTDASNIIPHKLAPLYNCFKIYANQNNSNEALKMAESIAKTRLKIYTEYGAQIKSEALNYIRSKSAVNSN